MTFKEILKQRLHHDLGFDFYRRAGVRRTMEIYAKSSGILCGTVLVPDLVEICESEFFLRPLKSEEQVRISANKKEGEDKLAKYERNGSLLPRSFQSCQIIGCFFRQIPVPNEHKL